MIPDRPAPPNERARTALAALALISLLPSCAPPEKKATEAPAVLVPEAAPEAAACPAAPAFRPAADVQYKVHVEEAKKVYESLVAFKPTATGWEAVETGFKIEGSFRPGQFGELDGATLTWILDAGGKPMGKPTETGHAKTLRFVSLFAFRFPLGAPPPACPGAAWTSVWEWNEGAMKYTARYLLEEIKDGALHAKVDVSAVSSVNRWDLKGEVDVAVEDGLSGEMRLHVVGPGAPEVNVFDRRIRVRRTDRP